ncbi:MAG: glycolate oxidase subunit GlcF [Pseudomonadales bacterium]|nr:glycolate oxidase subunit GlcF [Pseudomonadales bacterium]
METHIASEFSNTKNGTRAEEILRSCVHCGFCNATCPTYQLLGNELDGPRGRIYLIKQVLEDNVVGDVIGKHLDRCLTCRACETTCPSGVAYGELLEIGREIIQPKTKRSFKNRFIRTWLLHVVPHAKRMRVLLRLAGTVRWLLPSKLRGALPRVGKKRIEKKHIVDLSANGHGKKVILLTGCVQSVVTPQVNYWLTELLGSVGIEAIAVGGCCGSLALHLGEMQQATQTMSTLVDSLTQVLDALPESSYAAETRSGETIFAMSGSNTNNAGDKFAAYKFAKVDAIISTASGCGVTVKDFDRLLKDSSHHAGLATYLSSKVLDVSEYLSSLDIDFTARFGTRRIAWQSPCTLQHGQKITSTVEQLLERAGYELLSCRDSHLCCGSAGTYSILEPELSFKLRDNKLAALSEHDPDFIVTGNIGCQSHIQSGTRVPVKHWIELLAPAKMVD